VKYAFIEEQRTQHSVRRMCRVLEVSHAGYYEWRGRVPSARAIADGELLGEIAAAHRESRRTYGGPVFTSTSARKAFVLVPNESLMKNAGIVGTVRRRFRKTTDSSHECGPVMIRCRYGLQPAALLVEVLSQAKNMDVDRAIVSILSAASRHASSSSISRVRTLPAWRMSARSSSNSRGLRFITRP
jgi:putative transposase